MIITTSTLDKYREKLGTSTNDQYAEYPAQENNNLMYEEEENYNATSEQQPNLIRYGSDPDLRELPVSGLINSLISSLLNISGILSDPSSIPEQSPTVDKTNLQNRSQLEGRPEEAIIGRFLFAVN